MNINDIINEINKNIEAPKKMDFKDLLDRMGINEIKHEYDHSHDEIILHLTRILMDRSIPEENKVMVRKKLDEVVKLISITMKLPTVILEPKSREP